VDLPGSPDGAALLDKYALLRAVRTDVTKQLEEVRASGAIGSSLQAELAVKAAGDKYDALAEPGRRPEVRLHHLAGQRREGRPTQPRKPSRDAVEAPKCERCWHYRRDVGHDHAEHPGLCGRCTAICSAAAKAPLRLTH
jgi:isoleucyl-tRNA synthetase